MICGEPGVAASRRRRLGKTSTSPNTGILVANQREG